MGSSAIMQQVSLLLLALSGAAFAAECLDDQVRTTNVPTGSQIRDALTKNEQLDHICAGNWRVGDPEMLENTFNHDLIRLSVQRSDNSIPLRHCLEAFNNIITECIEESGVWGGSWSGDGEVYNITNMAYPNNPLNPDDEGGPGNVAPDSGVCDLPKDNAATFVDSGAAQYLQDFLAANGHNQWLKALEESTTNSDGSSVAPSCGVIESANCFPFKDCRVYTPSEFYYIRFAAGMINQYFTRLHEALQDNTILSNLRINDIIADFRPPPELTIDPNDLWATSSALAIGDKIFSHAKILGPLGDVLGFVSGIMGIAAAKIPGAEVFDIEGVRTAATNYLAAIFDETRSSTAQFLARLFGDQNEYSLSDLVDEMKNRGFQPISDSWDPTAIIMALPWMGGSDSVDFTEPLRQGIEQMNHGLIGGILKAMGRHVAVLKDRTEDMCDLAGSRFIDGQCFMLSRGEIDGRYWYLEAEEMDLLETKYGVNLDELYKNVQGCKTESGQGTDFYPSCFIVMDYQEIDSCKVHGCVADSDCESACFDGCIPGPGGEYAHVEGECRIKK